MVSNDNPSHAASIFSHSFCRVGGNGAGGMIPDFLKMLCVTINCSSPVWHDSITVFGDTDVGLGTVVMVCVYVVMRCAVVSQWQCCH